jgi:hypothetical protein
MGRQVGRQRGVAGRAASRLASDNRRRAGGPCAFRQIDARLLAPSFPHHLPAYIDTAARRRRVLYSAAPALICHAARPLMADQTAPSSLVADPRLVGREREQVVLHDALGAALARRGSVPSTPTPRR